MRLASATTANSEAISLKDVLVFFFIKRSLDFTIKSAHGVSAAP
jgi:hypothetical protein